jgi:hypothetical protein
MIKFIKELFSFIKKYKKNDKNKGYNKYSAGKTLSIEGLLYATDLIPYFQKYLKKDGKLKNISNKQRKDIILSIPITERIEILKNYLYSTIINSEQDEEFINLLSSGLRKEELDSIYEKSSNEDLEKILENSLVEKNNSKQKRKRSRK